MWDKDDPKTKWFHLAMKIVGALIIFKLGVLVGEFKIIKSLVVGGGAQPKMLFRGDDEGDMGARFFNKRVMPMGGEGNVMMWKGDAAQPTVEAVPTPPAPPAPPAQ
jgi:hypothetical protein